MTCRCAKDSGKEVTPALLTLAITIAYLGSPLAVIRRLSGVTTMTGNGTIRSLTT
jgi:hypothetical protein